MTHDAAALQHRIDELEQRLARKDVLIEALKAGVIRLRRGRFGRSAETLDPGISPELPFAGGERPDAGFTVRSERDDGDAEVRRLRERPICFDEPPSSQRWLWREDWLCDPVGDELCLCHAGASRRYPPYRLPEGAADAARGGGQGSA